MITVAAPPEFVASPQVTAEAKRLCLDLQEMLRRAAICTLPQGNRRFRDWVFDVREGTVVAMTPVVCTVQTGATAITTAPRPQQRTVTGENLKPDEFQMYDQHDACNGVGCSGCSDGEVLVVRKLKKI